MANIEPIADNDLFQELAAVIGADSAAQLFEAFVGSTVYVPLTPDTSHPIAAAIGIVKATMLGCFFYGTNIYFPVTGVKRARIIAMGEAGKRPSEISKAVLTSRSTVYQVLSDFRRARRQTFETPCDGREMRKSD